MNLKTYLSTPGTLNATELAERIGAKSATQVRQWQHGYGGRVPGPEYCVKIERVTDRKVTRQDLRPDDWHEIWPELIPAGVESGGVATEIAGQGA